MANGKSIPSANSNGDRLATLFWQAKHTTTTYCLVFWGFGMCVAFLGPTLLDLGCQTKSVTSTMSWTFFAQSLFILVGSAVGGKIIHRMSVNVILFVSTAMSSATLAVIPMCHSWGLLALVLAVMGFFMGLIDTVANVSMITLYGKSVSPFLQTLHFFYGLGAFMSPMIAENYLLNEDCSIFLVNATNSVTVNTTDLPAHSLSEAQQMTHIDKAFWIMSLLQLCVVVLVATLLFSHIYKHYFLKMPDYDLTEASKPVEDYESVHMEGDPKWSTVKSVMVSDDHEHQPANAIQIGLLTLLTAFLLFVYDGLQAVYGGYVFTYAKKNLAGMSKSEAAYLNAYFWGTFALGRLISIIVATKLTPALMLLGNISGCTIAMLTMLIFDKNRVAIYLGTCMFGAFLSSVYPTAVSLAEQFIKVTSGVTSVIVVGAASGEMILPVIVGHQMDESPGSFMAIGFAMTLASFFIYGAILAVGGTIVKSQGPGWLSAAISWISSRLTPPGPVIEGENTGLVNQQVKYYNRMGDGSDTNLAQDDSNIETLAAANYEINHEHYVNK
ncbi:Major facilitator super domain containing 4 [Chamberlinius hualienensis]